MAALAALSTACRSAHVQLSATATIISQLDCRFPTILRAATSASRRLRPEGLGACDATSSRLSRAAPVRGGRPFFVRRLDSRRLFEMPARRVPSETGTNHSDLRTDRNMRLSSMADYAVVTMCRRRAPLRRRARFGRAAGRGDRPARADGAEAGQPADRAPACCARRAASGGGLQARAPGGGDHAGRYRRGGRRADRADRLRRARPARLHARSSLRASARTGPWSTRRCAARWPACR